MPSPASPDTNQFTCPHCGRSFNEQPEFAQHEAECAAAHAAAGPQGQTHALNDKERQPDRDWKSVP